jgi:hypothetical protein
MGTTLQRILAFDADVDYDRIPSHQALLREYWRRMTHWAEALNCREEWPYFDVAAHIDPAVRASAEEIESLDTHFRHSKTATALWMTRPLQWAVHWDVLKEKGLDNGFNLPDPYEPIIILYERGGTFALDGDGMTIYITDISGVIKPQWRDYHHFRPYTELDEAALDQLDAQAGKNPSK